VGLYEIGKEKSEGSEIEDGKMEKRRFNSIGSLENELMRVKFIFRGLQKELHTRISKDTIKIR
jgi:hypothetical protein